mmetsp:Transcript_167923/g.539367  ORF Transcript_167923/g.539367 Transcript_167923/m.539367 type:complete len:209 (-) Transcript_167923:990-1616(-)
MVEIPGPRRGLHLELLPRHLPDPLHMRVLRRLVEGDDRSALPSTACAASSVHVLRSIAWRTDLEHQSNILEVDASGHEVRGQQHVELAARKGRQDEVAILLRGLAVHGPCSAGQRRMGQQHLGLRRALGEDDASRARQQTDPGVQQMHQDPDPRTVQHPPAAGGWHLAKDVFHLLHRRRASQPSSVHQVHHVQLPEVPADERHDIRRH